MNRDLRYLPEVARDYADAFGYYEALSPAAALRFDEAFSRAEADVEKGMVTHQRVFQRYHRVFIGNFPYHLYYRLTETHAVILGVLYARFAPARIGRPYRRGNNMNPMSEGLRNWPPNFQLNQPIPFEEDQRLEFKHVSEQKTASKIIDAFEEYAVGLLNTDGGASCGASAMTDASRASNWTPHLATASAGTLLRRFKISNRLSTSRPVRLSSIGWLMAKLPPRWSSWKQP